MKIKIIMVTAILAILFSLNACAFYTGYIAKDGGSLKEFEKPEALLTLTEKPKKNISIIDVRPSKAYSKGHILRRDHSHPATLWIG